MSVSLYDHNYMQIRMRLHGSYTTLMKQQFVIIYWNTILQEAEKTWQILCRPTFKYAVVFTNIQHVSKWSEWFQSAITALKTHAKVSFPHGTKQQVLSFEHMYTWFEEQNYRGYGDHHTWHADHSVAGIGLSPQCVPCDQGCTHWTFVGRYHKLVELLFHFY
jgi:hypothetical protein